MTLLLMLLGVLPRALRHASRGATIRIPRARFASCAAPIAVVHRLPTSADTLALGARIAQLAQPGDQILLRGDYGAGKTCLTRGFVRAWLQSPDEPVTSPSYLIDNVYPDDDGSALCAGVTVHHMDLWRLAEGKVTELVDLPHVFTECVSLIEWPDRLGAANVPAAYLAVDLVHDAPPDDEEEDFDDDAPRTATLTAVGDAWAPRLAQLAPEDVG